MKSLFSLTKITGLVVVVLSYSIVYGQSCVPASHPTTGMYPEPQGGSNLNPGCNGAPYNQWITAKIPADTVVGGQTCTVNNYTVTGVTGLPIGITYTCNPGTCIFPGGFNSCITLSGTANDAPGTFTVNINGNANITHPVFGPLSVPITFGPYSMTVGDAVFAHTTTTTAGCGLSDGSATVFVDSGGTGPITFLWSTSDTTATINNISAGAYSVVVTDSIGCAANLPATVSNPAAPNIDSINVTDATCFGNTNGFATVYTSGGAGGNSFSWSSGGTSATEFNLGAGSYTVTITDMNSCSASAPAVVSEPAQLSIIGIGTNDPTCNGDTDGSATVAVAGGTAAYTYIWSSGGTLATESNLAAGSYTVTISDTHSCTTSGTTTISDPPVLTANAGTISGESCTGCNNGSAGALGTGGSGSYSYSWAPSGGNAQLATGLSAGIYTVTITDGNGCTATATTFVPNTTGLANEHTENWNVYPNPVSDYLNISVGDLSGTSQYQLFDLSGRQLLNSNFTGNQYKLDLSGLNKGSYVMVLTNNNNSRIFRIIRQ